MPAFISLDDDTDLNLDDVRLVERHHPPLPGQSFTVITFCNGTSKTVWGHLYPKLSCLTVTATTLERNLENEIDDKEEANP